MAQAPDSSVYFSSFEQQQTREFRSHFASQISSNSTSPEAIKLLVDQFSYLLVREDSYAHVLADSVSPACWHTTFSSFYEYNSQLDPNSTPPLPSRPPPSIRKPSRLQRLFNPSLSASSSSSSLSSSSSSSVVSSPSLPVGCKINADFCLSRTPLFGLQYYTGMLSKMSLRLSDLNCDMYEALAKNHASRPFATHLMLHLVAIPLPLLQQAEIGSAHSATVGEGTKGAANLRLLFSHLCSVLVNFLGRVSVDREAGHAPDAVESSLDGASSLIVESIRRLSELLSSGAPLAPALRVNATHLAAVLLSTLAALPARKNAASKAPNLDRSVLDLVLTASGDAPCIAHLQATKVSSHHVVPLLVSPFRTGVMLGFLLLARCPPTEELRSLDLLRRHAERGINHLGAGAKERAQFGVAIINVAVPCVQHTDANAVAGAVLDAIDLVRDKFPALAAALRDCPPAVHADAVAEYLLEAPRPAADTRESEEAENQARQIEEAFAALELQKAAARRDLADDVAEPTFVLKLHPRTDLMFEEEMSAYLVVRRQFANAQLDLGERAVLEAQCIDAAMNGLMTITYGWYVALLSTEQQSVPHSFHALLARLLPSLLVSLFSEFSKFEQEVLHDAIRPQLSDLVAAIGCRDGEWTTNSFLECMSELWGCAKQSLMNAARAPGTLYNLVDALVALSVNEEGQGILLGFALSIEEEESMEVIRRIQASTPVVVKKQPDESVEREYDEFFKSYQYYPVHCVPPAPPAPAEPVPEGTTQLQHFLSGYRRDHPRIDNPLPMIITPTNLVESSMQSVGALSAERLRISTLRVTFVSAEGEEQAGIDQGGLRRTWIGTLAPQMAQTGTMLGLLSSTEEGQLFIHPLADLMPEAEAYFTLLGRVIGLSITNANDAMLFPVGLAAPMYSLLLGRPLRTADHDLLQENFLRGMKQTISSMVSSGVSAEDLALYDSHAVDLGEDKRAQLSALKGRFGSGAAPESEDIVDKNDEWLARNIKIEGNYGTLEFSPNGSETVLEADMICSYAMNIVRYNFGHYSPRSMRAFVNSFREVCPLRWLTPLDPVSMAVAVEGSPNIDVEDWHKYSKHEAMGGVENATVKLFWEIVRDMDDDERAQLLCFVTAQSRLPPGGFSNLVKPFCVHVRRDFKVTPDTEPRAPLPIAHSCYNQLEIAAFESKSIFASKLKEAIHVTDYYLK